jgi:SM-20-related protein
MPNLEFFRSAGLFLKENFLPAQQCQALRQEMMAGDQFEAALERQGVAEAVVDPYSRKTKLAKVSKASRLQIRDALTGLLPALSSHFGVTLTGIQPTNYLVYREGDFFARHLDMSKSPDRMESKRKVSIVIFLNDQTDAPGEAVYSGGSLTFFGLQPPPFEKLGHPITGKEGLLVAFRSDVLHEVRPVTRGTRLTVVSWVA